jgi:parallel beta-helix repeat protein
MSRHLSSPQVKRVGIIGAAVVLMAVIWFVFFSGSGEPEVTGCVGETRTFVCGDTITESCKFNGDIYSTSMIGFTIGADDITIDGNGYSLIGPGEQSGEEAIHCEGHRNITIKNLNIDYYFGIFFQDVNDSEITGCTISYDYGSAIWLWSSCRNRFIGNSIGPGTGGHGILLWDSSENTIEDNDIHTGSGGGVSIEENSNYNSLYGNFICGNTRGDILVDASSSRNAGSDNTFDTVTGDLEDESRSPCPD